MNAYIVLSVFTDSWNVWINSCRGGLPSGWLDTGLTICQCKTLLFMKCHKLKVFIYEIKILGPDGLAKNHLPLMSRSGHIQISFFVTVTAIQQGH